jgi:hypothetical protein
MAVLKRHVPLHWFRGSTRLSLPPASRLAELAMAHWAHHSRLPSKAGVALWTLW